MLVRGDRVEFVTSKGKKMRGKIRWVRDSEALVEYHSSNAVKWMRLDKLTKTERGSI